MKIAIAQLNPIIGDLAGNTAKILAAAQKSVTENVDLLLTPELALCGYPPRDLLMHGGFIRDLAIALENLAQTLPKDLAVIVGTVQPNPQAPISGGKSLFNSAVLLHQGKIQQAFHKRLLPTYDVFDEDRYFEAGDRSDVLVLSINQLTLRIGVTICEDLWNDQEFWGKRHYASNPVADLVEQHVDLLINLSASPYALGKPQVRASMLQHMAIAHHIPLIYANQVGANDDLIFDGNSLGWNRQGEVIGRAASFEEDLLILEYDQQRQDLMPTVALEPNHEVDEPDQNAELMSALVLGVKDYAAKCGFKRAVIGLSGGIDSALVAAIACEALGAAQVLGMLMPSPYSSQHSIDDALQLAQNLGMTTQTIPIQPMMAAFDQSLAAIFTGQGQDITEENLQSRIRGNLLMAIANKFGHLLLSTGNKSEMSVGYCTLYGDMNGGLAVIADLFKTRVYALCDWLNRDRPIIPAHILTKPPSAELKPDQVDQDSLPPYEILDDILQKLISDRLSSSEIINTGHDAATVQKVVQLLTRAEFKRRQAPPVLKISDRAFGLGWRMPIASKRTGLT